MIRKDPDRAPTVALALVVLALAASGAMSQTPPAGGPTIPEILAEADTAAYAGEAAGLLRRVAELSLEYEGYQERLAGASQEDSLVINLQMERRVDDFMDVLPRLVEAYPTEATDEVATELRRVIGALTARVIPLVRGMIAERRADIDELRARRTVTPPAERAELEARIARRQERLDALTGFLGRMLTEMRSRGLGVGAEVAAYGRLLEERADELTGRIDLATQRLTDLRLLLKADAGNTDLPLLQTAARASLDVNTASLRLVVELMDEENLPVADHKAYLLAVSQDLASGLLDAKATATLLRRLWHQGLDWLVANGPGLLLKLVIFFVIIFLGRLLARLVHRAVEKSLARDTVRLSQLLRRTIVSSAHNAVIALALMIGLSQLGLNLGPLLAGFGVVGFILGFAMQDSLSNFAAGLMILFYRPYDVGDVVDVSGVFGKVEHMSLVSTSILTFDNQKLVVPNSKIWGDVIKNVTDQHVRRVDMTFGISYSDDIPHAEKVLAAILADHEKVLDEPASVIKLHTLNDSSVDFVVRPWVKTADYWEVYWDVTREVKMRFDAEGISIPFPQRDVHIHNADKAAEAEG